MFKKLDIEHVSEIDKFLHELDKELEPCDSQIHEITKHERIATKRDNEQEPKPPSKLPDDF